VLVDPSLKSHCQEVGDPPDVSVNCTACPGAGDTGLKVKEEIMEYTGEVAAITVMVRLSLSGPEMVPVTRVTV
jgi:hypothetical protein